ncbi:MAG: LysM peptidoglycan-binding domain-containing protein [Chlamydiales bacterium]|nr:LysM peptidoglycan-binding domain-containing protein [Chlamydiales bacterium]
MSQEIFYRKRCTRLGYALGLSCFLNISVLAFGLYEWQEAGFSFLATSSFRPQKSKVYRQNGKELATLTQSLRECEKQDYNALIAELSDTTGVAEGYSRQSLALSMLAHKHYLDIDRAIGRDGVVRRLFTYMSQEDVPSGILLYPDLTSEQFAQITNFIKTEKWPLTPQGLLALYKQNQDLLVKDAFVQTKEYRTLQTLLIRGSEVTSDEVFALVSAIDYKHVIDFYNEMVKAQDFSPEVRRGFLVGVLPESATILYKTDPRFCVHTLTDKQVLLFLTALHANPVLEQEYALALLETPRSKQVWNTCIVVLSEKLELDPETQSRNSLLERHGRILPQKPVEAPPKPQPVKPEVKSAVKPKVVPTQAKVTKAIAPTAAVKPKTAPPAAKPVGKPATKAPPKVKSQLAKTQIYEIIYPVQPGDTLWQIAKRYHVDVEKIKKHNNLTSTALKPGSTLRIPKEQKPSPAK